MEWDGPWAFLNTTVDLSPFGSDMWGVGRLFSVASTGPLTFDLCRPGGVVASTPGPLTFDL